MGATDKDTPFLGGMATRTLTMLQIVYEQHKNNLFCFVFSIFFSSSILFWGEGGQGEEEQTGMNNVRFPNNQLKKL